MGSMAKAIPGTSGAGGGAAGDDAEPLYAVRKPVPPAVPAVVVPHVTGVGIVDKGGEAAKSRGDVSAQAFVRSTRKVKSLKLPLGL